VNNNKKIALFGGTFNPPHIGHYLIAKEVIKQYGISKVFFIPAYIPPHKNIADIINAKHREKMVKLLINNEKDLKFFDYELKRKKISYTIDTVKYFLKKYPGKKIYFIAGSDAFYFVDKWKKSNELLKLVQFIVYARREYPKEKVIKKFPNIEILWAGHGLINIASTNIREKLKSGIDCKDELGEKIFKYIEKNRLYK